MPDGTTEVNAQTHMQTFRDASIEPSLAGRFTQLVVDWMMVTQISFSTDAQTHPAG